MSRKHIVFLAIAFITLLLSFYSNFFRFVPQEFFDDFDAYDKGFVYGKIINSEEKGIFADGNFCGLRMDTSLVYENAHTRHVLGIKCMRQQKDMYLGNMEVPPHFQPYRTQIGTIAGLYTLIHKIVPASPQTKMNIFDFINALINALIFLLFFKWILKEYGTLASCVTLVLMLFSTWFISFCGNIWWVAGSFYLPIFGMFLMLSKNMPEKKMLFYLFLLFAAKCILTGVEFITCTFLSVFVPIIYYFYYRKKSFKEFFIFSVKAGAVSFLGILVFVAILVIQHWAYSGNIAAGFEWIGDAYLRRSSGGTVDAEHGIVANIAYILSYYYWFGDVFDVSRLTDAIRIPFTLVIHLLYINLLYLLFFTKKKAENRKYRALAIATFLSWVASVSWYMIFRNHAWEHMHIDFICWYMPLLLYCFVGLGVTVSILYRKYTKKNIA